MQFPAPNGDNQICRQFGISLPISRCNVPRNSEKGNSSQRMRSPQHRFGASVWEQQSTGPGMADWLTNGLQVPKALTNATNKYRSDSDTINQFITEECIKAPENTAPKKECYSCYRVWAIENGLLPLSSRRFSVRLTKHGLTVMSDQRTWRGLSIRSPFAELQTK